MKLGTTAGRTLALCALLASTACYKATFISDPDAVRGPERDRWTSFFLWGLVGEENLDVHEFCSGGRAAKVQTGANFGTGIVTFLTLGIYAPRKVYVTCAGDSNARLEIDADRQGRPVAAVLHGRGEPMAAHLVPTEDGKAVLISFEEEHR